MENEKPEAPHKLRVKIGINEFEAEGPETVVKKQFEAFLVALATPASKAPESAIVAPSLADRTFPREPTGDIAEDLLAHIFDVNKEKNLVSLHVSLPANDGVGKQVATAMLLITYGFKKFLKMDQVGAGLVLEALKSGFGDLGRTDIYFSKLDTGLVIRVGKGKGSGYRITPLGEKRAESVVRDLIKSITPE